ncbi:MAG: hypothetical protein OHK93_003587 [Ramalina farinacea]|uniref:C2H2-type domain-containing protein n=1 Tax=Ramalina farinacea TaxID=258253 RepID=A0AA43QTJ8_9LECA|nr:hypothetical protein [Ramalina farinacea]
MSARVIDLTGSSPPRKKVKTSSKDQALTQSLLAKAIDAAPPDRLRKTLHTLRVTSNDFARALSDELLVTPRIQMGEEAGVDINSDNVDEEADHQEEDDDYEDDYDAGVVTQSNHPRAWFPGMVRTRYTRCDNCKEEFDVTDNLDDEAFVYHDGELEVNEDMFADHDEDCHGPMDSEQNRIDYPEGFAWSCCNEDGSNAGCLTGRHLER